MENKNISRKQLLETLKTIISQSEFLGENLISEAKKLKTEKLEQLIIITFQALKTEKQLSKKDKSSLAQTIINFFKAKQKIYEKAHKDFIKQRENSFEKNEKHLEKELITSLN